MSRVDSKFINSFAQGDEQASMRVNELVVQLSTRWFQEEGLFGPLFGDENVKTFANRMTARLRQQIQNYRYRGRFDTWIKSNTIMASAQLSSLLARLSEPPTVADVDQMIEASVLNILEEDPAHRAVLSMQEIDTRRLADVSVGVLGILPSPYALAAVRYWIDGIEAEALSDELGVPPASVHTAQARFRDLALERIGNGLAAPEPVKRQKVLDSEYKMSQTQPVGLDSQRQRMVAEYVDKISKSQAIIFTNYRGLTVADLGELRRKLRDEGGVFQIVKNSLFRRALEQAGIAVPTEQVQGPVAVGYCLQEVPPVVRTLTNFAAETKSLQIRGAILGDAVLDADGVRTLADLPSRKVLLAQLLGAVQGPMSNLLGTITAPLHRLVLVLLARSEHRPQAVVQTPVELVSAKLNKLIEVLNDLTLQEAAELSEMLQEKWRVSAAVVVRVAAVPVIGVEEPAGEEKERTEFDVVLKQIGPKKIQVIKAVRTFRSDLGLREARELVDSAPTKVLEGVAKEQAETAANALKEQDADVGIVQSGSHWIIATREIPAQSTLNAHS